MIAFLWLAKKPRPWGFFLAVGCTCYAPARFALDFLREHEPIAGDVRGAIDPRYFYLTPAQWECFALFGAGLFLLWRVRGKVSRGEGFEPAEIPEAFQSLPDASSSKT